MNLLIKNEPIEEIAAQFGISIEKMKQIQSVLGGAIRRRWGLYLESLPQKDNPRRFAPPPSIMREGSFGPHNLLTMV